MKEENLTNIAKQNPDLSSCVAKLGVPNFCKPIKNCNNLKEKKIENSWKVDLKLESENLNEDCW